MNDIAAKIIMSAAVILGCILILLGLLHVLDIPFTIGVILVTGGIMAQVALVLVPLFKAISDRIKEKKAEKEEDSVGPGIK